MFPEPDTPWFGGVWPQELASPPWVLGGMGAKQCWAKTVNHIELSHPQSRNLVPPATWALRRRGYCGHRSSQSGNPWGCGLLDDNKGTYKLSSLHIFSPPLESSPYLHSLSATIPLAMQLLPPVSFQPFSIKAKWRLGLLLAHPILPLLGPQISVSPFDISECLLPGMLASRASRAGTFSAMLFRTRGNQQHCLSGNYWIEKVFTCTAKSDRTGVQRIPVVPDAADGAGSCPFPILLCSMWPSWSLGL